MLRNAALHWGWIALAVIALMTVAVTIRPAFRQPSNMVVIRRPGHRWFGDPQPAQASAAEDLPYALLSYVAYASPSSKEAKDVCVFNEAHDELGPDWYLWPDFLDADQQNEMNSVHLRAQVWGNSRSIFSLLPSVELMPQI
jgi:hypothetical protein